MKMRRKWPWVLAGLTVVLGELLFYPIRTQFFRAAIVAAGAAWVLCLTIGLWKRRRVRWIPLIVISLPLIFLALPGREADPAALRAAYVKRLRSYDGVRYVWGGENWRGVDCSGYLRAAMVDALAGESLCTLNPALARRALWLWWNDASAFDMGQGYRGITRQVAPTGPLPEVSENQTLEPGDFAVTSDGSHVLAYMGQGRWMEADPYDLRVEEIVAEAGKGWGMMKVVPCRWKWLEK